MELISNTARSYKVSIKFCCKRLELDFKRYQRWVCLHRKTGRYGGCKPGPKHAPHSLLDEEKQQIIEIATEDKYSDFSHRQLSVAASERVVVEASASSFYRVMKENDLMGNRQRELRTPQKKPDVAPTAPNQVWSWDLTYISLGSIFVYLFAIIDVYSRKIVGWHLSFNARISSMKKAWDNALVNEDLISLTDAPKMPEALSDHGVQMAQKSAKQFFKDLGIKQLFARYKTPTDNAWIESWFRILKYDCLRFKDYVSLDMLKSVIHQFIVFYNTERCHGRIGYVTPEQMHTGKAEEILRARAERKRRARQNRLEVNRELVSLISQKQVYKKVA